jgi:DNA mismatch repair protein MutS2
MNHQAFGILEFDSLRGLIQRRAQTDVGRARVNALEPLDDFEQLQRELRAVSEMIELRARGARLSFAGIADPTESISRLRIAGTALEPLAMLDLARMCERALDARSAINSERESCPTLFEIVAALLKELGSLANMITKKILPSGELDDRASPELARIRRELATARSRITRSLESLMRRHSEAIQEELVTVRNDRFVIPVRSDHQARIKGVAHGSSSSGATVFIEPLETIEANNELQNLREAEQREIAEILFGLSEQLRQHLPAIQVAAEAIMELDFVSAKAAFGEAFDCVVPIVPGWSAGILPAISGEAAKTSVSVPRAIASGSGGVPTSEQQTAESDSLDPLATARGTDTLEFIEARHPLLEQSLRASNGSVVPVSFKLDPDHPVMVISGANAGGKTVVLKTAGLLSLMALSGLPVPAKEARVPFYQSVLADIGDQQSIAANLSTFTSHMSNIARMIELCEPEERAARSAGVLRASCPALVLLDEVGTGTDPEEGSALGVAVVDHFKQRGAHVMATTHYSGLKMYAANEAGVLNASVEFDEKTLRPTYRLLVGLAGSSSGLEIARRFGIPNEVITSASEHVQQTSLDAFAYLRRIKRESEEAEALRQALEEERAAVADRFASLDVEFRRRESARQHEFEKELARAVSEFQSLSRELISKIEDRVVRAKVEREAERRAAELKREAQTAAKAMSDAAQAQTRSDLGKSKKTEENFPTQLRGVRVIRDGQVIRDNNQPTQSKTAEVERADANSAGKDAHAPSRDIRVGDRVRLRTLGSNGIVDRIRGDEAELRVGSLHMREKLTNLELIDDPDYTTASGSERGSSPTVREGALEKLRKQATTTELHLRSQLEASVGKELNLIGKKTDEAVDLIDKFLDQAFLSGATELRIIHGHGTGALRKAVTEFLSEHPHVERFAPAPQDQGGSGAMLVTLRQ